MFAQMTMDRNPEQTKATFKERIEEPVFKGLLLSTIAGALLGGIITFNVLMFAMTSATLAGSILAGAGVGASAGLLLFGLADIVIGGRLEEGAELVEDEAAEMLAEELQIDEMLGQEEKGFTLRKAS